MDKVHEALAWLDKDLCGHDFAVGDNLSIADFSLIASVSTMLECGVKMCIYKNIKKWVDRCKKNMPEYEEANAIGAKKFGEFFKSKF